MNNLSTLIYTDLRYFRFAFFLSLTINKSNEDICRKCFSNPTYVNTFYSLESSSFVIGLVMACTLTLKFNNILLTVVYYEVAAAMVFLILFRECLTWKINRHLYVNRGSDF